MDRAEEFKIKLERIKKYLEKAKADGVALSRTDHFAWATCGANSYVNTSAETGVATLLITGDKSVVLTNRIESRRLLDEELGDLPVEVDALPWQADRGKHALKKYIGKNKILTDADFAGLPTLEADFSRLMYELTDAETGRYRTVGARTGRALQQACKEIGAGMSENEIAGVLARRCLDSGVLPIVTLVAADERISSYRHPLPTDKKLEKTAMLVVCGKRHGLIASCTRMVSVGKPAQELVDIYSACVIVDVNFNMGTMPGKRVGDIFKTAQETYRGCGYDGEWDLHHQGGPTGYRTRYYTATEESDDVVAPKSAFAWNPSITGAKSEDTLLVLDDHNELITQAPDWPQIEIECEHMSIQRPDILVI